MKKVSIVIPLYKSEKFLEKLIESIVNQTYQNMEIILVDDGSPDNSGEIAESWKAKDERIIVIHQANKGTCEARNTGLKKATGEYLMFADGDDWLEVDCVEYLVNLLEDNDCDMSMTDSVFTTRDRVQNELEFVKIMDNRKAVASIINTFYIPVGPWNKLYKMDIVQKNNISFSVAWFGEGLYFSTMAAMYSNNVAVGHRRVYNYRLNNPNSGCTKREVQNAINSLNNILYIKDKLIINSCEISEALDWHIWTNNFNLVLYIVEADLKDNYSKEYISAKNELKRLLPKVIQHSMLPMRRKLGIIAQTYFPELMAKRYIKRSLAEFKKDIMA